MKTLAEFTRTTLIGGLLIILPIYIAVLLLAKTRQRAAGFAATRSGAGSGLR